jgi:hypothetical protein
MQQKVDNKVIASTTNINSNKTKPVHVEAHWQLFFRS